MRMGTAKQRAACWFHSADMACIRRQSSRSERHEACQGFLWLPLGQLERQLEPAGGCLRRRPALVEQAGAGQEDGEADQRLDQLSLLCYGLLAPTFQSAQDRRSLLLNLAISSLDSLSVAGERGMDDLFLRRFLVFLLSWESTTRSLGPSPENDWL